MPSYEYRCPTCGHTETIRMSVDEYDRATTPQCHHADGPDVDPTPMRRDYGTGIPAVHVPHAV